MKLKLETEVYGEVLLDEEIIMKLNSYLIKLTPDEQKVLHKISIEKPIVNYLNLIPKITIEGGKIKEIIFPKIDFIDEQIGLMQLIESFGSLDLDVKEINWDNPIIIWIPENEEERSNLPIPTYRQKGEYGISNYKLTKGWLEGLIWNRGSLGHLVLPFSFYRKGINHYHRFEYIEAFLNFYLMLEGVFGEGNTKNKLVEKSFLNSFNMNYALDEAIKHLDNQERSKFHKQWLEDTLQSKNWQYNKQNLTKLLVDKRGDLSHYSLQSSKKQRNYFENKNYHSLAFISMLICRFASVKLRFDPFRPKKVV